MQARLAARKSLPTRHSAMPASCAVEHGGVDLALRRRPLAGEREGTGDVGGVDLLGLDAHVGEQEVTGPELAVVAPPVQRGAVRPGSDDGRVADLVALEAGAPPERALEPALASDRAIEDQRDLADDVGEATGGRVAGVLQAGDLPVVLDQAQLVDDRRELLTGAAGEQRIDDGVVPGQQGALLVAPGRQGAWELGQRAAVDGQDLAGLGRGGDVAHPDRAELVVGEVPLGSGVVVLADVERGVVAQVRRFAGPSPARHPRPSRRSARRRPRTPGTGTACRWRASSAGPTGTTISWPAKCSERAARRAAVCAETPEPSAGWAIRGAGSQSLPSQSTRWRAHRRALADRQGESGRPGPRTQRAGS